MKIEFEIKDSVLKDILRTAFGPYGATWVGRVHFSAKDKGVKFTEPYDGENGENGEYFANFETIGKGIGICLGTDSEVEIPFEETDGPTADVYLQYGLFGEIKYS